MILTIVEKFPVNFTSGESNNTLIFKKIICYCLSHNFTATYFVHAGTVDSKSRIHVSSFSYNWTRHFIFIFTFLYFHFRYCANDVSQEKGAELCLDTFDFRIKQNTLLNRPKTYEYSIDLCSNKRIFSYFRCCTADLS